MIKQTNEKLNIIKKVKNKKTGEIEEVNVIHKYGCLFMSLLWIAEDFFNKMYDRVDGFDAADIKAIYNSAVFKGYMCDDCWVLNHSKIIELALQHLGVFTNAEYLGKIDLISSQSFGRYDKFNYILKQSKTKNGNGHFYSLNYDPYFDEKKIFEKKFLYDMSIRLYRVK